MKIRGEEFSPLVGIARHGERFTSRGRRLDRNLVPSSEKLTDFYSQEPCGLGWPTETLLPQERGAGRFTSSLADVPIFQESDSSL